MPSVTITSFLVFPSFIIENGTWEMERESRFGRRMRKQGEDLGWVENLGSQYAAFVFSK